MSPVIIAEGLDVFIFDSREEAERYMEAPEVAAGVLRAWDGDGRALSLHVVGKRVCLSSDARASADPGELAALLRAYLAHFNDPAANDSSLGLSGLVVAAYQYAHSK